MWKSCTESSDVLFNLNVDRQDTILSSECHFLRGSQIVFGPALHMTSIHIIRFLPITKHGYELCADMHGVVRVPSARSTPNKEVILYHWNCTMRRPWRCPDLCGVGCLSLFSVRNVAIQTVPIYPWPACCDSSRVHGAVVNRGERRHCWI